MKAAGLTPTQEGTAASLNRGRPRRSTRGAAAAVLNAAMVAHTSTVEPTPKLFPGELLCLEVSLLQNRVEQILAMSASSDPDILYHHEAMKAPDREEFIKAMEQEFGAMMENGCLEFVLKEDVPEGMDVLPAVWAMRRKRRVLTSSFSIAGTSKNDG